MKKVLLFFAVVVTMMLSSCGLTHNAINNENQNQTSVVLSQANYEVVGTAVGESCQTYVLGFGGMSKKSMEQAAVSEMYKNADLKGSQAIVNSNVYFRIESYVLWCHVKAIAHGTIVEFKK